jgi:hypothetical protein
MRASSAVASTKAGFTLQSGLDCKGVAFYFLNKKQFFPLIFCSLLKMMFQYLEVAFFLHAVNLVNGIF